MPGGGISRGSGEPESILLTGPMEASDWIVIVAGLGAIAWVNWYFFVAGRREPVLLAAPHVSVASTGPAVSGSSAEITIVVDGGYTPSVVRAKAGQPLRLIFDRRDTGSCSEEVVLPDFAIRRFLPTGQKTTIEITPAKPGRYEFMCGMSMLRGAIVAEP